MAKVELKAPIVDEISGHLNGAQGVVLVDYRGLTVEQDTQLRKQLREAGVVYKVYKNTLVKRAIAGTEFEPMTDMLEGPTAIAICTTDATAPARILREELLSKFLGSIQSPITNFARVIKQIAEKNEEVA